MAAKIGTGDILFRVGSGSPSKVFLGSTAVQTVPPAPVGLEYDSGADEVTWAAPASDGGSPILHYRVYINGFWDQQERTAFAVTSPPAGEYEVSAVNAIGEGPKDGPITVP
jgi:hypothetical protein